MARSGRELFYLDASNTLTAVPVETAGSTFSAGKPAKVFVGAQVILTTPGPGSPTSLFKNAGAQAEVAVETLPDGRYRLNAKFEETSVLPGGVPPGDNPILQTVRGESRVHLREGETVPFASAVDAVTGEVVRVDLTVIAAPPSKAASAGGGDEARLRAHRGQGAGVLPFAA